MARGGEEGTNWHAKVQRKARAHTKNNGIVEMNEKQKNKKREANALRCCFHLLICYFLLFDGRSFERWTMPMHKHEIIHSLLSKEMKKKKAGSRRKGQ